MQFAAQPSARDVSVDNQGMRYARVVGAPVVAALALAHPAVKARPVVSTLSVPASVVAGRPPQRDAADRGGRRGERERAGGCDRAVHAQDGRLGEPRLGADGRTGVVTWPSAARLTPGGYQVSVSAHDRHGATLARGAQTSGVASLTVTAPAAPAAKAPAPAVAGPVPAPASEPGVPTVAQTVADGAIFPVAGPHNFGGPENVFGAPRDGYLHQGQDILTAEGTPVVAPLVGTILTTSYQEGGAGYYAVEETAIGFDFMFAHCQAASLAVSTGEAVAAGQGLCRAGETGDATAPHLDFEMSVGGWQAATGHPINPLPYLEAWEG